MSLWNSTGLVLEGTGINAFGGTWEKLGKSEEKLPHVIRDEAQSVFIQAGF